MHRIVATRNVIVWQTRVYPKEDQTVTALNREIRDWLGENIGSGTWETELREHRHGRSSYVQITFDIEAEDDAMAFKLRWS